VIIAGSSALLAVPRPVDATEIPEPALDARALLRSARADTELAAAAARDAERGVQLDFDVRALGSALRAYGAAEARGADQVTVEKRKVGEAAARARPKGEAPLLALRAYELRSFLREVGRWEATGLVSDELREVGGPFIASARQNGWTAGRRVIADDAALRALFKKRWSKITGIEGPGFELSLDEARALYRFLIEHPPRGDEELVLGASSPALRRGAGERIAYLTEQYRLKKIDELAAVDPAYPADLARGVVFYRERRYPLAAQAFQRHLEAHPQGPFTIRAQNYLRAALGHAAVP
jgi:hypothetical protein